MLGHKARDFGQLTLLSLNDLVPEYNFHRQLENCIDYDLTELVPDYSCLSKIRMR